MRNGVVHVQQIERVSIRHVHHARSERQAIRRVLEQRVTGNFHFVIVDAGDAGVQAYGVGVGDEVDFVAARGQLHAELGGDDAAAAIRGIAGDADVHVFSKACLKHSLMTAGVTWSVRSRSRFCGRRGWPGLAGCVKNGDKSNYPQGSLHGNTAPGIVREMLIRYGDRDDVRRNLLTNFSTEGWTGRASEHYRSKEEVIESALSSETEPRVREWMHFYISYLRRSIHQAKTEEEREKI